MWRLKTVSARSSDRMIAVRRTPKMQALLFLLVLGLCNHQAQGTTTVRGSTTAGNTGTTQTMTPTNQQGGTSSATTTAAMSSMAANTSMAGTTQAGGNTTVVTTRRMTTAGVSGSTNTTVEVTTTPAPNTTMSAASTRQATGGTMTTARQTTTTQGTTAAMNTTAALQGSTGAMNTAAAMQDTTNIMNTTAAMPGNTGAMNTTATMQGTTGGTNTTAMPGTTGTMNTTATMTGTSNMMNSTAAMQGTTDAMNTTAAMTGTTAGVNTTAVPVTTGTPETTGTTASDNTTMAPMNTTMMATTQTTALMTTTAPGPYTWDVTFDANCTIALANEMEFLQNCSVAVASWLNISEDTTRCRNITCGSTIVTVEVDRSASEGVDEKFESLNSESPAEPLMFSFGGTNFTATGTRVIDGPPQPTTTPGSTITSTTDANPTPPFCMIRGLDYTGCVIFLSCVVAGGVILLSLILWAVIRCCRRQKSKSFDLLSDIPHISLSDYPMTTIPRPSVYQHGNNSGQVNMAYITEDDIDKPKQPLESSNTSQSSHSSGRVEDEKNISMQTDNSSNHVQQEVASASYQAVPTEEQPPPVYSPQSAQ